MNSVKQLWDAILSRDPAFIQKTYKNLDERERAAIMNHLKKMTTETGWHLEQKRSAQTAVDAIRELDMEVK